MRRIKLLTEYCLETITEELKSPGWGPGGEAGFQRLLPLRRAMSELESDIREAHHAISDAMRNDERVDALLPRCSRLAYSSGAAATAAAATTPSSSVPSSASAASASVASVAAVASIPAESEPLSLSTLDAAAQRDSGGGGGGGGKGGESDEEKEKEKEEAESERRNAARRAAVVGLLQTHLWRIRAAGGQLSELSQQVEATREVWELFLDGVRNRTVRLNLQATIMTLALSVTAVPASLAGMNIPNGFEEAHPALFWGITGILGAVSVGTWAHFMGAFRSGSGLSGPRMDELRALRFVLQRMDELDDVMRAKTFRGGGGGGADVVEGGGGGVRDGVRSKAQLVQALREVEARPDEYASGGARVTGSGGGRGGGVGRGRGGGRGTGGRGGRGGGGRGGAPGKLGLVVNELDPSALDLIFKVFDMDGDGRIDPSREWVFPPRAVDDLDKGGRQ